jgi:hypothetical protein
MDLASSIALTSYSMLFGASVLLALLVVLALRTKHPTQEFKRFLFTGIITFVAIPTLYMTGTTVFLNTVSASKGPVHWHADFEIWNCGQEVSLKDPVGMLNNKIGTATLHEHNDNRLHVEGVVEQPTDASLGTFFRVVGGELTPTSAIIPTNVGQLPLTSGSICPDGQEGTLQVFVLQTDNDMYYSQKKIADPQSYEISPYADVPKGDCIIVEFGPERDRTDHMCRSYQAALQTGVLKGERE